MSFSPTIGDAPNLILIQPATGENRVLNCGVEGTLGFGVFGANTFERVVAGDVVGSYIAEARHGVSAIHWQASAKSNVGGYFQLAAPRSGVYVDSTAYFWIKPVMDATLPVLEIGLGSSNALVAYRTTAQQVDSDSRGWLQYSVFLPASAIENRLYLFLLLPQAGTHSLEAWVDDLQVEEGAAPTTWIYGGLGRGFKFDGPADESASLRAEVVDDELVFGHGRLVGVDDDENIILRSFSGLGLAPVEHVKSTHGLQPGAILQRVNTGTRQFTAGLILQADDTKGLHEVRKDLILKLALGPAMIRYAASGIVTEVLGVYKGGLDWGPEIEKDGTQTVSVQFEMYDPYAAETTPQVLKLAHSSSLALDRVTSVEDGRWRTPGAAAGSSVGGTAILLYTGPDKAVYAGTQASAGQTAYFKRFTGQSWTTLGSFTSGDAAGPEVRAAIFSPDGQYIFVGGHFSAVGGVSCNNLASYNRSTGVWTSAAGPTYQSGASAYVDALEVDTTRLFIGGAFDRIANGATVTANFAVCALGSGVWTGFTDGPNGRVRCLERMEPYLFLGGDLLTAGTMSPPTIYAASTEYKHYGGTGLNGGLAANHTYTYQVTACSETGETIGSNAYSVLLPNDGTVWIRLYWTKVEGASYYRIYRTAVSPNDLGDLVGLCMDGIKTTSWWDEGLHVAGSPPLIGTAGAAARTPYIARYNLQTGAFSGAGLRGFDGAVYSLHSTSDGRTLAAAGAFTLADGNLSPGVALWRTDHWIPTGKGLTGGTVRCVRVLQDGSLLAVGAHTAAGGRSIGAYAARYVYSEQGGIWLPLPLQFPAALQTATERYRGDLYFGHASTATISAPGYTSVVNRGTAPSWPDFEITGPARLRGLVNITTGEALYCDYTLVAGEHLRIITHPAKRAVESDISGSVFWAVLPGSALGTLHIRPKTNDFAVSLDNATNATRATLSNVTKYLSVDA